MLEPQIYTFKSDPESGIAFTKGVSVVAFFVAPIYLYIAEDVRNIYFLGGFALFAALIPFALRGLRALAGGIEALSISEDSIELIRRKSKEQIPWTEISKVEFENVNDMPWITLFKNEGGKERILLEDFDDADREKMQQLISGHMPDNTQEKTTWIIANRLSFSSVAEKK